MPGSIGREVQDRDVNANADAHADTYGDADADTHADTYGDADTHADTYSDADTHADTDAHLYPDTIRNSHTLEQPPDSRLHDGQEWKFRQC